MTSNKGAEVAADRRQQLVASLLVRNPRITRRQIQELLARPVEHGGVVNPLTGNPYALSTIHLDVDAIRAEWQEKRLQSADKWVAGELATLEELQIQAWRNGDLAEVRRISAERRKLLGLDAPTKTAFTDPSGAATVSFGPGFLTVTERVEIGDDDDDGE